MTCKRLKVQPQSSYKNRLFYAGFYCIQILPYLKLVDYIILCSVCSVNGGGSGKALSLLCSAEFIARFYLMLLNFISHYELLRSCLHWAGFLGSAKREKSM